MNWPEGWAPFQGGATDDSFVQELRREMPPGHVLKDTPLRTIGKGDYQDNVLFEILDGSGRVAAVHLTYSSETDARWPDSKIYEDWSHFEREGADF